MENLSKSWTFLIIGGVIAVIASAAYRFFEIQQNVEEAFSEPINGFVSTELIPIGIENHLKNATDFE